MAREYGFEYVRSSGSHDIYKNDKHTLVIPFYKGKDLHNNLAKGLVKQIKTFGKKG